MILQKAGKSTYGVTIKHECLADFAKNALANKELFNCRTLIKALHLLKLD